MADAYHSAQFLAEYLSPPSAQFVRADEEDGQNDAAPIEQTREDGPLEGTAPLETPS